MSRDLYRLEGLSFGHARGAPLLESADFVFPDHFITVVQGRQGAGVSSFFRLLVGLIRPSGGKLWLGQQDVFSLGLSDFNAYRLSVGTVFEQDGLLSNLNLLDNLVLPLLYHGLLSETEAKGRARELMASFGMDGFLHERPAYVSKAARKAAALSRALILRPRTLVLDHPTDGLHDAEADVLAGLLENHRAEHGLSRIIVSTEDTDFVSRFDHSVIAFRNRKLIQPEETHS